MPTQRIYKITFLNQGQVYEVYARPVNQGALLGFVEVEGLVFGEKTRGVVDPSEEHVAAFPVPYFQPGGGSPGS